MESVELDRRAVDACGAHRCPGPPDTSGPSRRLAAALPGPGIGDHEPAPRGMDAAVPAVLRQRGPARIVYVSCDPGDAGTRHRRLGPAYRLTAARCFDLFPQTAHVETVGSPGARVKYFVTIDALRTRSRSMGIRCSSMESPHAHASKWSTGRRCVISCSMAGPTLSRLPPVEAAVSGR